MDRRSSTGARTRYSPHATTTSSAGIRSMLAMPRPNTPSDPRIARTVPAASPWTANPEGTAKAPTDSAAIRRADLGAWGVFEDELGVWDNLNTHVSHAMAELIAARPWLPVSRPPPSARELTRVEPLWPHLKRSLANLTKHNLAELTALVKTRLKRMQYRPGVLVGFLASIGL